MRWLGDARWLIAGATLAACGPAPQPEQATTPPVAVAAPLPPTTEGGPACGEGMVAIDGGRLTMGLPEGHAVIPAPIEVPTREVEVAAFCIDRTEVTVAAYQRCVDAGHCSAPASTSPECNAAGGGRDEHPANCVTWAQANNYCGYRQARLPTEPEWAMAARGGEGRLHPWGAEPPRREPDPIFDGLLQATRPVGARPRADTPQGVADLAGNVWEWTSSDLCMHDDLGCDPSASPAEAQVRALRGSSNDSLEHRSTMRFNAQATRARWDTGFRCAGPGVAARVAEVAPAELESVHWSAVLTASEPWKTKRPLTFPPDATLKVSGRVICMVDLRVSAAGMALDAARAASGEDRAKFESGCDEAFAALALDAARRTRWEARATGFETTAPVFMDRDAARCPTCITVAVGQ